MSKKTTAIANYILQGLESGRKNTEKMKREAAKIYSSDIPTNAEIIATEKIHQKFFPLLRKKPIRTLSGITTVAVMVRPHGSCKHACIYCPHTEKAPRSYTGEEPAALRARGSRFSAAAQVKARLLQYKATGHPTDKCEVIIMGGTFLEMPSLYKKSFVKSIYETMNGKKAKTLNEAKNQNEKAKNRIIGLTIETRPDVCGKDEINQMLEYGATRVELGVQHPDDKIYKKINRGHKVSDVIKATALLKDSAFKVLYHIMPGLPGSDRKKDIGMIKKIFGNPQFRPDMLKIYPTLCIKGTPLYDMMKKGDYEPYTSNEAADIIAKMHRYIPRYVRIMRIQRDIPAMLIDGGVKKSNLRELVEEKMREEGIMPQEIRSREIGIRKKTTEGMEIKEIKYDASKGTEFFISFENDAALAGFIRLRFPNEKIFRPEINENTALIRELHVYGEEKRIGEKGKVQHSGIGKMLMEAAEEKARNAGYEKIAVISGIGAREYYYKLGYSKEGAYILKILKVRNN